MKKKKKKKATRPLRLPSERTLMADAKRFLLNNLRRLRSRKRKAKFTGLHCVVFPGSGYASLDVRLESDGDEPEFEFWSEKALENLRGSEKVTARRWSVQPAWLETYERLLKKWLDTEDGGKGFYAATIAPLLEKILSAIAKTMVSLEKSGELAKLGFLPDPLLYVFSEDDTGGLESGLERIEHARGTRKRKRKPAL